MNVLVVDDNPSVRESLLWILEIYGLNAFLAGSFERALELLAHCDLIILDWNFGYATSKVFLDQLKIVRPQIEIIICTASPDQVVLDGDSNVIGVVEKPVDLNEWANLLRKSIAVQRIFNSE